MPEQSYVGTELDLFAAARNWKSYWSRVVLPFVSGDVLEVGAGTGSNTALLAAGSPSGRWVCLEPDPSLATRLKETLADCARARPYEFVTGTLEDIPAASGFDTIVYFDVLEHITADRDEIHAAARRLRPGGHIVVLSPAHQWLFTPFDAAIGHCRRYDRPMLRALTPSALDLVRLNYLDSIGLFASAGNRLFLRQSMPTAAQLRVWDNWMVPVSRVVDRLTGFRLGKSILAIWRKPA